MIRQHLAHLQFGEDRRLREALMKEPWVAELVKHGVAAQRHSRLRAERLGFAVRLDAAVAPSLWNTASELAEAVLGTDKVEFYVEDCLEVNAGVAPSTDSTKSLVTLTSGAVNGLDLSELRFLIGHELGHVLFDHPAMPTLSDQDVVELGSPAHVMRLRAWDRSAEISADRVGLVCCGSFETASRALFKALTGITAVSIVERPDAFADQWRCLQEELTATEARHWEHGHPFDPLRMRALTLFAEALEEDGWPRVGKGIDPDEVRRVDGEVSRMLDLMNPDVDAEPMGDARLADYLFWGGLYVAFADGDVVPAEIQRIQTAAPEGVVVRQLVADLEGADARCVRMFREEIKRRPKLRAVEKYAIISGLVDVASADGRIDAAELERLRELGGYIGVSGAGCELILRQHREEGNHVG